MILRALPLVGTGGLLFVVMMLSLVAWETLSKPVLTNAPSVSTHLPERRIAATETGQVMNSTRDISAALERPLFEPTRRPIVPSPETDKPQEVKEDLTSATASVRPEQLRLTLHGIVVWNGVESALLSLDGDAPEWMRIGADVSGWTISEVGESWIVLVYKNQKQRVDMY